MFHVYGIETDHIDDGRNLDGPFYANCFEAKDECKRLAEEFCADCSEDETTFKSVSETKNSLVIEVRFVQDGDPIMIWKVRELEVV
jgi:hypothetical protein